MNSPSQLLKAIPYVVGGVAVAAAGYVAYKALTQVSFDLVLLNF